MCQLWNKGLTKSLFLPHSYLFWIVIKGTYTVFKLTEGVKISLQAWREGSAVKDLLLFPRIQVKLIPTTDVRWLTTACNSNFGGSNTLFWSLPAPAWMCIYIHIDTHKCTLIKNKRNISFFSLATSIYVYYVFLILLHFLCFLPECLSIFTIHQERLSQ